jgi:hypothetical protein
MPNKNKSTGAMLEDDVCMSPHLEAKRGGSSKVQFVPSSELKSGNNSDTGTSKNNSHFLGTETIRMVSLARYWCASATAVECRHTHKIFLKRWAKVDIYSSKKSNTDYFYGVTNPNMFDDALKTKEKLKLD